MAVSQQKLITFSSLPPFCTNYSRWNCMQYRLNGEGKKMRLSMGCHMETMNCGEPHISRNHALLVLYILI